MPGARPLPLRGRGLPFCVTAPWKARALLCAGPCVAGGGALSCASAAWTPRDENSSEGGRRGRALARSGARTPASASGSRASETLARTSLLTQTTINTFPYIQSQQPNSEIEHEASTCRISEDQLFYLQSRGIEFEEAVSMMVSGFCRDVFNQLPMEFAAEADKLLSLKLEGSIG